MVHAGVIWCIFIWCLLR